MQNMSNLTIFGLNLNTYDNYLNGKYDRFEKDKTSIFAWKL